MHVLCQQAGGKQAQRLLRGILWNAWEGGYSACPPAPAAESMGGFLGTDAISTRDAGF